MTSFINIFGGAVVNPSSINYLGLTLNENVKLSWTTQFLDSPNVVSNIMNIFPTGNGFSLTLPDATQTSVGQSFLFNNPTAFTFILRKNDGTPLLNPFPSGGISYFYLTDNTTQGGTWTITPWGTGGGVTLVAAVSDTTGITITGSPIAGAGTFTFDLGADLAALNALSTTGIAVRTGVSTWNTVDLVGGNNISITNPGGIAGNPTIALEPDVSVNTLTVNTGPFSLELDGNTIIPGNNILIITANGGITLPLGNTAQRAGTAGSMRFNIQTGLFEGTPDGVTWNPFGSGGGSVTSVGSGPGLGGGPITTSGTLDVVINRFASGRLTLVSGTPVTTGNTTAATVLYYTPYTGNYISLFTGGVWTLYAFNELSIAVPASVNQMYDVFIYDTGGGVLGFDLTAWTNDSARATAIFLQNGIYVKSGFTGRRYVGSFRTLLAGQTEDSTINRLVWNYDNRVLRNFFQAFSASSWTYNVYSVWRSTGASDANRISFVIGIIEDSVNASYTLESRANGTNTGYGIGFGLNSTSTLSGLETTSGTSNNISYSPNSCSLNSLLPSGYNFLQTIEIVSGNIDTITVYSSLNSIISKIIGSTKG